MTQTAPNQHPDYSQWPTKEQAAAILDCSTKSVEKFTAGGKLQAAMWRRPSGGPKIAVYHPVDVERLRRERFPEAKSVFTLPAPSASENSACESSETSEREASGLAAVDATCVVQLLGALLEAHSQRLLGTAENAGKSRKPAVPIQCRVYLTVTEAAAYAGLPEKQVRVLIAVGSLPARRIGHTRVLRADLDELRGERAGAGES